MMKLRAGLILVVWCVLLVHTTAMSYKGYKRYESFKKSYKRQEILTCWDKLRQDDERPLPEDYEGPACDENGNYRPVQCFGEWTGKGQCNCVKPLTGERYTDIKGVEAYAMKNSGGYMTCQCALDHVFEADRATYCDQYTGDYKHVLCIGEKCRCAERWGAPMHSFGEFNKGESNCLCARRSSDLKGMGVGLSVDCNPYGQFEPVQCTGSMCFCVDKNGTEVGMKVPIQDADKLQC